jgi:hypothetical protein
MLWFLSGWLTSELALFHILLPGTAAIRFALASDALRAWPGLLARVLVPTPCAGLLLARRRARPTRPFGEFRRRQH